MRLKSYFSSTVEAAMLLASRELGEDAMLVYSREATPETRYLGRYEVVFSVAEPPGMNLEPHLEAPGEQAEANPVVEPKLGSGPALELLVGELTALRSTVDRLDTQLRAVSPATPAVRQQLQSGECQRLIDQLTATEISPTLLPPLVETVDTRLAAQPGEIVDAALTKALLETLRADARIGKEAGGARVIMLVGPPGAGKTTAIAKLAARYLIKTKHAPLLLSFDTYRIGGADQLRTFASLLGVPFEAVESSAFLLDAIQQNGERDLILIDTSGYGEKDIDAAEDLIRFLSLCPACEVQLTLSATTKTADLTSAVRRFERFRPQKLIFTRLDETSTLGPVWSEAVRTGWALSFFSEGQQVPEDLHPAVPERLVAMITGNWLAASREAPSDAGPAPEQTRSSKSPGWLAGTFLSTRKPAWMTVPVG